VVVFMVIAACLPLRGVAEPLEIEVNYIYRPQGEREFRPLLDGGRMCSGDAFKIIFTPRQDCYVYIFQIDAAGQIFCLFPMQVFRGVEVGNHNPVQAGQTYYLPSESKSFVLDDVTGPEKIYFLASRRADAELEEYQRLFELKYQHAHPSAGDLAAIDQMLGQLEGALEAKGNAKGIATIDPDPVNAPPVTWQEDGQTFSVLRQRLEGLCDGCLNMVNFQHQ
jgi:hypothetical protein